MKLLTVIDKLNIGGIENTFLKMIPHLKSFELSVFTKMGGVLDGQFKDRDVTIYESGRGRIKSLFNFYFLLRKHQFDVIHIRDGFTSGFLVVLCRLHRIPAIVSIHSFSSQFKIHWKNKLVLSFIRSVFLKLNKFLIVKYSSKIIAHSKSNLNEYKNYLKANGPKFTIIYNGIDFKSFKKETCRVNKNTFTIMHLGSFKTEKNHLFLILAFKKLIDEGLNLNLILCGDGKLKYKIENSIEKLNLTKKVFLKGNVANPGVYLYSSNLFLFPSLSEGFGNVLIEAQYCGLPICASKIEAHYESVHKEYHKYFFNPTDLGEAVFQLRKIIGHEQKGKLDEYKKNAKLFAEQFSIEKMAEKFVELYREISLK